jgi:cyclophilin family peptidyl-prolyl cis-trans isomerase
VQRRGGKRGERWDAHAADDRKRGCRRADVLGFAPMLEGTNRRAIALVMFALLAIGAFAGLFSGCGGSDSSSSDSTATTTASAGGCKEVEAPKPKQVSLKSPPQTVQKGEELTAVVQTNCGTFEIALDSTRAPKTVNSFAYLAEEGFYDDLTFHRIVPGFVIQGGDPLGNGSGGPGYSVDEAPPPNLSYTKGTVAMAKTEVDPPGRSGSQFYVVTAPDAGLPPEYALVGKVSEGYDIVTKIEGLGTPSEAPKQTVLIEKMTIEKG